MGHALRVASEGPAGGAVIMERGLMGRGKGAVGGVVTTGFPVVAFCLWLAGVGGVVSLGGGAGLVGWRVTRGIPESTLPGLAGAPGGVGDTGSDQGALVMGWGTRGVYEVPVRAEVAVVRSCSWRYMMSRSFSTETGLARRSLMVPSIGA